MDPLANFSTMRSPRTWTICFVSDVLKETPFERRLLLFRLISLRTAEGSPFGTGRHICENDVGATSVNRLSVQILSTKTASFSFKHRPPGVPSSTDQSIAWT